MALGLVDVIIVLLVIMGAIVGFKHGVIKEGTQFIGLFAILVISFILKDRLMILLYENLPFYNFFGIIKCLDAINVLLYQIISFVVIFIALMFVLKVLIVVTGFVEWLLKMTVFLSLPSRLLGMVVGAVEYYVYLFLILYVLNLPVLNLNLISDSKFGGIILEKTPVLSGLVDDTVKVYGNIWGIIKNRNDRSNKEVNTLVLATLLDNHLITVDSAKKLVESGKIIIEDESILDLYEEEESLFELLGGCNLIDCDGTSKKDKKQELFGIYFYSAGDYSSYNGLTLTMRSISDNGCASNRNCDSYAKLQIVMNVQTQAGNQDYTIVTNGGYQLISGTNYYLSARVVNGSVLISISE